MNWDTAATAAIVLSLAALIARWLESPRAAALCGLASSACSLIARRRAREHAGTRADATGGP